MPRCHFLLIVTVAAVMLIYKDSKMSTMFLKSDSHSHLNILGRAGLIRPFSGRA